MMYSATFNLTSVASSPYSPKPHVVMRLWAVLTLTLITALWALLRVFWVFSVHKVRKFTEDQGSHGCAKTQKGG